MTINFCPDCNSIRHPVNQDGTLIYCCRNCKSSDPADIALVSRTVYKGEHVTLEATKNIAIILDPALPRKLGLICPTCKTKDPLYYQTTENDMTLTYVCTNKACVRTGTLEDFNHY